MRLIWVISFLSSIFLERDKIIYFKHRGDSLKLSKWCSENLDSIDKKKKSPHFLGHTEYCLKKRSIEIRHGCSDLAVDFISSFLVISRQPASGYVPMNFIQQQLPFIHVSTLSSFSMKLSILMHFKIESSTTMSRFVKLKRVW